MPARPKRPVKKAMGRGGPNIQVGDRIGIIHQDEITVTNRPPKIKVVQGGKKKSQGP